MKYLLLSLTIVFCAFSARSQSRNNYWTLGVQLNVMNYFGDLNPTSNFLSTEWALTSPSFGIDVTYKFKPNFRVRTSLIAGRIQGDDFEAANPSDPNALPRYVRNLHFRSDILELSTVAIFDFLGTPWRFYERRVFTPYIFVGIAGFYHNPKAKIPQGYSGTEGSAGEWVALQKLHTEAQGKPGYNKPYSLFQVAVPVGIGMKFRLSPLIDLSIESGLRWTFTDYLDDAGGLYPALDDLDSDLARTLSDRSGEQFAAAKNKDRTTTLTTVVNADPRFASGVVNEVTPNGFPHNHYVGYGTKGEVRGNPNNVDYYLVTGFHLSYIITVKRYRPRR
jgi:hypothetical protein